MKKGSIGRVSYISNRHSKVNKKYLKSFDLNQESKHIKYLDANNLYGYTMSKFLPTGGFKWIDPKKFNLNRYTTNSSKGCALEVDLEYPKELGESLNDYPLAPDKIEIKREMFFECQLKIADFYNILIENVKKIAPNFFHKEKYVIDYKNLQLYLSLGLKLKNISCIESISMAKTNVEFNTQKRIEAEKNGDKGGKVLYKLMRNTVYGKQWKTSEIESM